MADAAGSKEEYISLFNEIIHRQTVVLGPDIAVIIGKKVEGLRFSDEGKVTDYEGDPQQLLQMLINGYVNLSGLIVRKTIEPLLAKHPGAAAQAVSKAAVAGVAKAEGEGSNE
jgi:hypothetical protein